MKDFRNENFRTLAAKPCARTRARTRTRERARARTRAHARTPARAARVNQDRGPSPVHGTYRLYPRESAQDIQEDEFNPLGQPLCSCGGWGRGCGRGCSRGT